MKHVILLGDSIFDNGSYVPGEQPVIEQVKAILSKEWNASLLAVDGDVTLDVLQQFTKLSRDATHLIISCGGNDALRSVDVLNERVTTVGEALNRLSEVRLLFQSNYRKMLLAGLKFRKPIAVCTVYDKVPGLEENAATALSLFNEIILKEAFALKIPVIDLRLVCTEVSDYSQLSPIEPSSSGGEKIAGIINELLCNHNFSNPHSRVYA